MELCVFAGFLHFFWEGGLLFFTALKYRDGGGAFLIGRGFAAPKKKARAAAANVRFKGFFQACAPRDVGIGAGIGAGIGVGIGVGIRVGTRVGIGDWSRDWRRDWSREQTDRQGDRETGRQGDRQIDRSVCNSANEFHCLGPLF